MNKIVLDASALLALLHNEPGYEQVAKALPYSLISAVNVAEVMSILVSNGMPSSEIEEAVSSLLNEVVPFDLKQATMVAELRKETKLQGLSLGDRACLGLAKLNDLPALTADKIWGKVNVGVEIQLLR